MVTDPSVTFTIKFTKMRKLKLLVPIAALAGLMAFTQVGNIPEGWFKAGSDPDKYEMGLDNSVFKDGTSAAFIQSTANKIKGFGTLMQTCSANDYLGKKVKMTGYIKSENVDDWAGLWLRVDGKKGTKSLSFDNMQDRPIKGTTDWTKCEIILNVPESSTTLNFGALLSGTGKIWFDKIEFEEAPSDIKTTSEIKMLDRPTNTNFDK